MKLVEHHTTLPVEGAVKNPLFTGVYLFFLFKQPSLDGLKGISLCQKLSPLSLLKQTE